ncbi:MAG TPA: hypothetical protein VK904_07470 [Miltoncostaeaceae bacterium]|nr:hypothetical protein [Miltoncostaeaceae bacterium]
MQRVAARGGWKRIGKVKTTTRARFAFTVRLRTAGDWTVRAAFAGNAALAPAGSLGAKVLAAPRRSPGNASPGRGRVPAPAPPVRGSPP